MQKYKIKIYKTDSVKFYGNYIPVNTNKTYV